MLSRPNSDSNSWRNSDTNVNSDSAADRTSSDAEPAAGIDVYFIECHFPVERGQRYRLWTYCWQFAGRLRHLRVEPTTGAFDHGK